MAVGHAPRIPKSKSQSANLPIRIVSAKPKGQKNNKPVNASPAVPPGASGRMRKAKGGPRRKGFLSTALDAGEAVANFLPGAIKGIRSIFNAKEASFATPASFASVQNNITQMNPERMVTHATLGLSGTRVVGSQPLTTVMSSASTFFGGSGSSFQTDSSTIPINPITLGAALGVQAQLYDRFVFRRLRFVFTTYVTTNTVGVGAFCYENDANNDVVGSVIGSGGFRLARQVIPNVTFPFRIPKAELDVVYDGPDLFYCNNSAGGGNAPATGAEERQMWQGLFKGFDANPPTAGVLYGFIDLEYEIEFYDPIPPIALLGSSVEEREAHLAVRKYFAGHRPKPLVHRRTTDLGPIFRDMVGHLDAHACPGAGCPCKFNPVGSHAVDEISDFEFTSDECKDAAEALT